MNVTRQDIPGDTLERQRRASRPQNSAWVSANAGSGKTHVLTQRVVRLLLGGVPPARILCLTFTKAAAANMAIRVFDTLAKWTALNDTKLAEVIAHSGAPHPTATDLLTARRLFARTVETPGGLKIQTIHAFCERLLHLFPFEANVAARFEVLDDTVQQDLLQRARLEILSQAAADETLPLGRAVTFLAEDASATAFEVLIGEALRHRDLIGTTLAHHGSVSALGAALGQRLGLGPDETAVSIERAMIEDGLPPTQWGDIARAIGADGSSKNTAGNRLATAAVAEPDAMLSLYLAVFLTKDLEPRADSYLPQAARKARPDLCVKLDAERERLATLLLRGRAAATRERTLALVEVAHAVMARYEDAKRRRGLLDFDDLVERTRTLLKRSGSAWVLYKLDAGIDHVLVDEAQDTSPHQWDILRAITADFFAGAGQARTVRTFFAVGDEKQSIFSFQGARPAMFEEMRQAFEADTRRADAAFESVPLNLSFRSSSAILETVDKVFSIPAHAKGLSGSDDKLLPHVALRTTMPGLVEMWPVVGPQPQPEPRDWRLPLDQVDPQSPPVIIAQRIAAKVAALIAPGSGETVEEKNKDKRERRPVRPGDVMILVRSRNALFEAVIRALKDRQVPVAGADRLQLTEHIAVMDLIAAGRTALLPEDDLTLACVLKSPLVGLDDNDLISLAPRRPGSLSDALAASPEADHRRAAAQLAVWRDRATRLTPFGFYTRLLGQDGGRKAMLARLGLEAGDALDEFVAVTLAHEREGAPSLLGFLARLEGQSLSVKRDMEAAGDAVRVMTVHAAKGLEAKIVFLPDTCGAPSGRFDPKLFVLEPVGPPEPAHLAWSPKKDADPPAVATARAALRQGAVEEHNRLLYVALTRAEERLYIAGFHGVTGRAKGCWYDMIAASELGLAEAPAPWNSDETILQRRDAGFPAEVAPVSTGNAMATVPDWLLRQPAAEIAYAPPIKPSNPLGAADQRPLEPEGFEAADRDGKRRNATLAGQLAHKLLQHLPGVEPDRRRAAARRILAVHGTGLDLERRETLADAVLAVIDHPSLAALFGPTSRAEVGIAGRATLADGRTVEITGQIDRISVTDDAVLIADFKTGRPHDLATVPQAYVAQLALYRAAVAPLYPGKVVHAFLVWTAGPEVLELPPERLGDALAELASA